MAAGYANSRPPVHPRVMERVFRQLGRTEPFHYALDIGCGSGVSTRALDGLARARVGLDPAEAMLRWAAKVAPFASFAAGTAEAIPLRDGSVDLITAAGSLNYAKLDLFFPEAARVLMARGVLVVYDFSAGRSLRNSTTLDAWFDAFFTRYPPPANEARELSPAILSGLNSGFHVRGQEHFEIAIAMKPEFYLDYVLTETNVAAALRAGTPYSEVRSWCAETLATVWMGEVREVIFRGYFACMAATARNS